MLLQMSEPVWSPVEAARLLVEVYAGSLGEPCDIDALAQEELARALDADPVFLEAAWEEWVDPMLLDGWGEQRIDDARYWLDAEFLGGLSNP
jgi:hypothetical protein